MPAIPSPRLLALFAIPPILFVTPAFAATGLDGRSLSLVWAIPFAGMLASIALGPRFAAQFWDPHYGKAAFFWAVLVVIPLAVVFGPHATGEAMFQVLALDYLPFILMLFALYTTAGGFHIGGRLTGTPAINVAFLLVGALAANLIGTIGASMVLIRPLLRANASRQHVAHVMIFFIFIVGNIGGALSPLGNAPLFFGFLQGIDFFWFATHLWRQALLLVALLLGIFFLLDIYLFGREHKLIDQTQPGARLRISGGINLMLIAVAIAAITMSALWHPGVSIDILGTKLELQNMLREATMLAVGFASLGLTGKSVRTANGFDWHPLFEVAALFAGIFVTIVPVMAMLEAGASGPFAPLFALVGRADGTPND
ncbi:MAG TPA: sodium:proton antiporter, partial [Beijerinckiaceae bacterium]|nr:sodium:proton antiporter [Beijerinckiaceae bacterium]